MLFNRTVQLPGDQLLPPSSEPLIPPDIRDREKVLVKAPVAPTPADERYWLVSDGYSEHPNETNSAWKNNPGGAFGGGKGLTVLPDICIFEFQPVQRDGGLPDFWEGFGLWIVGSRLLAALRTIDPEALDHRPILMRDPDGRILSEDYSFVDVTRSISAIDYANSNIVYIGGDTYNGGRIPPRAGQYPSARLLSDIEPALQIFRHRDRRVFVSANARAAILAAEPRFRNIDFKLPCFGF